MQEKIGDSFLTKQQLELLSYVKAWHGSQKRKYTSEPYWYHVLRVANLVKRNSSTSLSTTQIYNN